MKHQDQYGMSTASNVLSLPPAEVPPFMRRCIAERSLSSVVTHLNRKILSGDFQERAEAREALRHLGFL